MGLTRLALRFALKKPKIESFSRFLFIGPHPDDIEIGAGATAARLASLGKEICFLICMDGRFGDGNVPEEQKGGVLVEIRKQESRKSAEMLGVKDLRFLNLCDGGRYELSEMLEGIAKTVADFQPDLIFAPDPFVASESHKDHLQTGACSREIACFAPYPGIMREYGAEKAADVQGIAYYMTAKPNVFVKTSGLLPLQLKSVFSCHRSQYPEGSQEAKDIGLYLRLRAHDFGLRSFHRTAEGFRLLSKTEMHCLPEAGE
ncbi:MAG: PIG-L family deacetylase [Lachnospiraceae bacterium]|nr:PIG-L family deacetylase [Lachnospiraceae bacterium]